MSYDLFFEAGSGKKIDKKSFAAYFKKRANYKVGNGQAVYENEDTGVYFIFDEPTDGAVAFTLNYFRPHVFGLEAAIELEKFDEAFGMTVIDEQDEGMEEGTFSKERFLKGWNDGNRLAYKAMLKEQTEPVHTWPAKRIGEVWEWNYGRATEQERVGEGMFVPGIFAVELDGQTKSVAVWPPECTILMPEVDAVLLPCVQKGKGSEEMALVRWEEIHPVVKKYQEKGAGLARYRLEFEEWPPEIAAFLDRKRKAVGELKGVGMDEVLDEEIVEEVKNEK
jgi:hypothetical protein